MTTIQFKVADLYEFEGALPTSPQNPSRITDLVKRQFSFLPQPIDVQVDAEYVTISFQEESSDAKIEARRLAGKASKRAAEGNYGKAISIFRRVLEIQPSLHTARRDLAMAYVEVGDIDNALNHLIDVLLVDPNDAWGWVVLANLYIREKSDNDTGEKFLRKALDISPDDAWALNSLAAVTHERGKPDEAIELFERAIAANPKFPNAYHGKALVLDSIQKTAEAMDTLGQLFATAKMQDTRSRPVFSGARQLYTKQQADLAEHNQPDAFKLVQDYKAQMEIVSGFPVRVEEGHLEGGINATIQMAWKHNRDFHLIKIRSTPPPHREPSGNSRTLSSQA